MLTQGPDKTAVDSASRHAVSCMAYLGALTSAGMHAGTVTITARTPGTYRYLCAVPGPAAWPVQSCPAAHGRHHAQAELGRSPARVMATSRRAVASVGRLLATVRACTAVTPV